MRELPCRAAAGPAGHKDRRERLCGCGPFLPSAMLLLSAGPCTGEQLFLRFSWDWRSHRSAEASALNLRGISLNICIGVCHCISLDHKYYK